MAKTNPSDRVPELSMSDMNRILNNVYESCQMTPSTAPMEAVIAYTKYRQERFSIQKTIAVVAFVIFLMVPFLFLAPKFTVEENMTDDEIPRKEFLINIGNITPVRTISAEMNGYSLPIYSNGEHTYRVQPTENGEMTVTVTLFNGQENLEVVEVTGVDSKAPVLVSNSNDNKFLYLTVDDEDGLGIDYNNVYGLTIDNHRVAPYSCDEIKGEIIFNYPENNMNIIIQDKAGNQLQLVVYTPDNKTPDNK